MTDKELDSHYQNSSPKIARLEGQVKALDFTVSLLTKRLAAAEQREFMYQVAGLFFAWSALILIATLVVFSD